LDIVIWQITFRYYLLVLKGKTIKKDQIKI